MYSAVYCNTFYLIRQQQDQISLFAANCFIFETRGHTVVASGSAQLSIA